MSLPGFQAISASRIFIFYCSCLRGFGPIDASGETRAYSREAAFHFVQLRGLRRRDAVFLTAALSVGEEVEEVAKQLVLLVFSATSSVHHVRN